MVKSLDDLSTGRGLSELIDKAEKVVGFRDRPEKKKSSLKEKIHKEVKGEKEYYKTEEDLEQKLPEKRIPISYLLEHGYKIKLEYALEYYKDAFKLLRFDPSGEILGLEIKLRNRYEAWMLLVPLNIYKNVRMAVPRKKINYITGKDIIEVVKEYPKYAEILRGGKYLFK